MNATIVLEAESVTRSIARWGSAAAAIIFGVGFVTDRALSWQIVSLQLLPIGFIVIMFAGYALAWTKRFEALGSVIALISTIAACVSLMLAIPPPPLGVPSHSRLFFLPFLAVGVPALVHLVAIALHRYVLIHVKKHRSMAGRWR